MIQTAMKHQNVLKYIAVFLAVYVFLSCAALPDRAEAVTEFIASELILAILAAFGVVVTTEGTIEGMTDGIESLLSDFSSAVHGVADYTRNLFNTKIKAIGWGSLQLGKELVSEIRDFIDYLKNDKGLTPDNPITYGDSLSPTITINGISYPTVLYHSANLNGAQLSFVYDGGAVFKSHTFNFGTYVVDSLSDLSALFPNVQISSTYHTNLSTGKKVYSFEFTEKGNFYYITSFSPSPVNVTPLAYSYFLIVVPLGSGFRVVPVGLQDSNLAPGTTVRVGFSNFPEITLNSMPSITSGVPGSIVRDEGYNLDVLDGEDGESKDVVFTPDFPNVDNPDLSNVEGFNEAAREQLDNSLAQNGTAEAVGELDVPIEQNPGSGGAGNVPPIIIPSGGWFSSIWHYVVKALQDSADGVAFIMRLISSIIPPQILNLCWASAVLLITFGIVNKFLK